VIRSGDVIPKILGRSEVVDPEINSNCGGDFIQFKMPSECPVCGSPTERVVLADTTSSPASSGSTQGASVRCTGGLCCSAQAIAGLHHFCGRDAADIKGLGSKAVEELYAAGIIKTPADIYRLKKYNEQQTDTSLKLVYSIFNYE